YIERLSLDSQNMLPALLGESRRGRNIMLEESFTMSLRNQHWKYIAPVTKRVPDWLANKDVATGLQKNTQLYNLKDDPSEEHNLAEKFPDKVKEMEMLLEEVLRDK